ncbi:MAG TPA: efflux RND transporter periplasmic adaptor subunit, partial [Ramlibacter sp.]
MKRTHIAGAVLAAVVLAAGSFHAGRHLGAPAHPQAAPATAAGPQGERKVLYWHDPMVPGPRFDKPGKSPFMDMQLVPVYADEQNDTGVKVSPGVQQNLGIRTAAVTRTQVASSFDAVGAVQFDERLTQAVQTRVNGYVERLLVRAPMESVRRGQPLATIYAPDWLAPQNEYLALKRAGVSEDLLAAARDRMRALSIPEALVRRSEQAGTAQARFTVAAPVGGVVAELGVREGVAVNPGMTLFRIAGLERVWAVAEVPEAQAVYRRVLEVLRERGVEFLVGGAYAFTRYTAIERSTKDFDVFVRYADRHRALDALYDGGFDTELTFPHWLGKAFWGDDFCDVIFGSGNGVAPVDDGWFEHAPPAEVLGVPCQICPAEEVLWSKSFVMERERYDGADVIHLLRSRAATLDWPRLL